MAKRPCSLLAKRACSFLAKQLCSPARGKALSGPTANARACGGGVCACSCAVPGASATDACASGSSTAHPGTDPDCSRASRTTSRPRATVPLSGNAIDPCTVSSVHLARIAAKLSPFITSQIPHSCGTCCLALRPPVTRPFADRHAEMRHCGLNLYPCTHCSMSRQFRQAGSRPERNVNRLGCTAALDWRFEY